MLSSLLLFSLASLASSAEVVASARTCSTVNGVSGACHLKLNQFTLAGTHNSGAGAYGAMYHWAGTQASGCWYPNQDKTITEQLVLGVRYFDFDTAYIGPGHASGAYWEEGIVIVHGKAYSRSLRRALKEIEVFMGAHPDSLVVIRIRSDYAQWATSSVKLHLPTELSCLVTSENVRLNEERNPLLSTAISTNKRMIVFISPNLLSSPRYLHTLHTVENGNYGYAISNCFEAVNIENGILADARAKVGYFAVQVNWYNTQGLCNGHLAGVCDGEELTKLEVINKVIVLKTGRPINLVLIDYVGTGGVRLSDVVRRINEYNVKQKL